MNPTEKLIQACQFGDVATAEKAIHDGADINSGDGDYTPIHWAAQEGHIEIVGTLLDNGADINSHDREGFTPLQKAVGEDYPELVRYLLKRGADVNDRCKGEGTALHTACGYGRLECTNILLSAGADTTIKDNDGKIPEEYASMYGHPRIVAIIQKKVHIGIATPITGRPSHTTTHTGHVRGGSADKAEGGPGRNKPIEIK